MSSRLTTHTLTVCLPTKDHRSFVNARRRLRRIMGLLAPDLAALCAHNLRGRDPAGLAEDYLTAVGWPVVLAPLHAGGRRRASPSLDPARLPAHRRTTLPQPPADPCRN